ncbi:DUF5682 family protein [Peterkaempfera sp. SMS 1(5)a]|uniref:DUF5682 family protein n=1 Tax=Peterkaempfera podocarpi TaxID=3232308 RepID=UPI00366CCF7B
MAAVLLGVRHHSPACARLVARTVRSLRPAYVLIEGPADINDRLEELLLGHRLPIAVFSHHRDGGRTATSWAPLCDYSPEWVALQEGHAVGAEVRFIDLPAWHPAFAAGGGDRPANRYADAEVRYAEAVERLCRHFAVDSVDALWDRLFEVADDSGLAERLDAYFAVVRGEARADAGDRAREEYMAAWVRTAVDRAGDRPVVVVTGGFHQPALRWLTGADGRDGPERRGRQRGPDGLDGPDQQDGQHGQHAHDRLDQQGGQADPGGDAALPDWPEVPAPPPGSLGGSFLVPYSFRQLDAFAGYQSGMPSPGYYQQLWEHGPAAAGDGLLRGVTERLRARGLPVSTADLIAVRSLTEGLAALRGHRVAARVDLLDGLAGALISDDLDRPLPWTIRGPLGAGTHPAVVEMVAACTGDRVGQLHPDTPLPPLVHDVAARLAGLGLTGDAPVVLDLADPDQLMCSQVMHRLRVLGIPGLTRVAGPADGLDPVSTERWEPRSGDGREAALIEAGAYGARLDEAAAARLGERLEAAGSETGPLAELLFDTVLCGAGQLSDDLLAVLAERIGGVAELGPLGDVLATTLGLWRHDRLFGAARSPLLGTVVDGAVTRVFWLAEGLHGGSGVDRARLHALAAARDALRHAGQLLSLSAEAATAAALRIARDPRAPVDLRGAALGLHWSLGGPADHSAAVRSMAGAAPDTLGDWLAGLFALARDEVLAQDGAPGRGSLIDVLDGIVCAMAEEDFLGGLPALRQAFAFFPPRERERIARLLLERRGLRGSAGSLLRTSTDPLLLAHARTLEDNVTRLLHRHDLGVMP